MPFALITFLTMASLAMMYFAGDSGVSKTSLSLYVLMYFSVCVLDGAKFRDVIIYAVSAWLASSIVTFFLLGSSYGYVGIFTAMFLVNHSLGALGGFILYNFLIKSNKKSKPDTVKIVVTIIIIGALLSTTLYRTRLHNLAQEAATNRKNFLHRIAYAIKHESLDTITTQSIVNAGLAEGIYDISSGLIVHEYGGNIEVEKIDNDVNVTYYRYPTGVPCDFQFYFDTVSIYNFSGTYIDGNANSKKDMNTAKHITGKKYCFGSDVDHVNIVFTGQYKEFLDERFRPRVPRKY